MKQQKTLYIFTIVIVLLVLLVQSLAIRKSASIQPETNTVTSLSTEETVEPLITDTTLSTSSLESETDKSRDDLVEEYHEDVKLTEEQVVQISANAFVSFLVTNNEDDRVLLKSYTTKPLYESIINDNTLTEKRVISFLNLKELERQGDEFKLTYTVGIEGKGDESDMTLSLTMVNNADTWVVSAYEVD